MVQDFALYVITNVNLVYETDFRADSRLAPSQWETALLCNDISHWLGASLGSALDLYQTFSMDAPFQSTNILDLLGDSPAPAQTNAAPPKSSGGDLLDLLGSLDVSSGSGRSCDWSQPMTGRVTSVLAYQQSASVLSRASGLRSNTYHKCLCLCTWIFKIHIQGF